MNKLSLFILTIFTLILSISNTVHAEDHKNETSGTRLTDPRLAKDWGDSDAPKGCFWLCDSPSGCPDTFVNVSDGTATTRVDLEFQNKGWVRKCKQ